MEKQMGGSTDFVGLSRRFQTFNSGVHFVQPVLANSLLPKKCWSAQCHSAESMEEDELEQELPMIFGIGLARRVALMNHSCRPNCEIDYNGNATAVVKAIRPIPAGEELTISYIDETKPLRVRRSRLERRYGFRCFCRRCVQELCRFLTWLLNHGIAKQIHSNHLKIIIASHSHPHGHLPLDGAMAETEAAQLKEKGNQEVKAQNFRRAIELYSEAIEILPNGAGQSPRGQSRLLAELLGNRCLCQMRLKRYQEALGDAQRAVQVDASYTKGFYRLAICQKELSDLAGAWESAMRWSIDSGKTIPKPHRLWILKTLPSVSFKTPFIAWKVVQRDRLFLKASNGGEDVLKRSRWPMDIWKQLSSTMDQRILADGERKKDSIAQQVAAKTLLLAEAPGAALSKRASSFILVEGCSSEMVSSCQAVEAVNKAALRFCHQPVLFCQMSPDIKCSLRRSADAHSSALAHAATPPTSLSTSCLRLGVFGEGLVAAHGSNALALGLCEALAISGLVGEVFVCLYCGLSTASLMTDEPTLRDVRGRSGPNLAEFQQQARPDLLLIVAGGHDLSMHSAASDVALQLQRLLSCCKARPDTLVAAMAVPDAGRRAEESSLLGRGLTQRRHETNRQLASLGHDRLVWIGASSLPWGPRSVASGFWDGGLLSPKGARVLGGRLISILLPHLVRHRQRSQDAELPEDEGEIPSLDAFLKAFSLEDEAEARSAEEGVPLGVSGAPAPPWEVAAALVLQRQLRNVLGSKGKAQRLAVARLRVRQRLAPAISASRPQKKVTPWGLRLTAA
eukprot:s329_g20.t1